MKRRVVAALAALLVAAVGGVLLLAYVSAADQRAVADLAPVRVLVVTKPLPEGATAAQLADAVQVRELPGTAVAQGAATSVADLTGMVSTTSLQPGEQLLRSRLSDPAALQAARGVQVPRGFQRVSVQLETQRALNGHLAPGDTVAVFISVEQEKRAFTRLSLHKVLVTAIESGAAAGSDAAQPAPTELTVTLALPAGGAEKVVFAAEHGTLWLAAEPSNAPSTPLPVLSKENIYR
jgi:pilus assembly protein CpaB